MERLEQQGNVAMPDVTLRPVPRSEKPVFSAHFQEYLAELALFSGSRPDRQGVFHYDLFDHYWLDDRRTPFFIEIEGETAGFLLLRELAGDKSSIQRASLQVAEVCVFRPHRRRAVASEVMRLAAQMAVERGLALTWSAYANNKPARELYQSILDEFASREEAWLTEETQGVDAGGLARLYYRMTPPGTGRDAGKKDHEHA
jgi:predicted acetyltransferase